MDIYMMVNTNLYQQKNFKISSNQINLYDSWTTEFLTPDTKTFIDLKQLPDVIGMSDPSWPYIQITFALDETSQSFERRVQTLSFAMSIIGGLIGLVTSIIFVVMGWI